MKKKYKNQDQSFVGWIRGLVYHTVKKDDKKCLTADTFIMTTNGYRQIRDLINKPFKVVVEGQEFSSTKKGFWYTGKNPVYRIKMEHGVEVKATANHRFMTVYGWKYTDKMKPDEDAILLSIGGGYTWEGEGNQDDGYIAGFLIGNKVYYYSHIPMVDVLLSKNIHPNDFGPIQKIKEIYWKKKNKNKDFTFIEQDLCYKKYTMTTFMFKDIAHKYKLFGDDGKIHVYEKGSYDFTIGLLKGVFDACGIIYNNVHEEMSIHLWEDDLHILYSIQRLLLSIGVISNVKNEKTHNELTIKGDENMAIFKEKVGFFNNEKKLVLSQYKKLGSTQKKYYYSRIVSIDIYGEEDVYDCTIERSHCFSANCLLSHNWCC